ncbi:MAG TPA: hypothetical protein VNU23_07330 [Candidatus Cybelea sp.]|jgi:hypothetical protein|nr:hypothetical protein [Candidatus Cybelea sp.]
MLATGKSLRTPFLVLAICLMGTTSSYSQSPTFFNASGSPIDRTSSGVWLEKCEAVSANGFAGWRFSDRSAWPAVGNGPPEDFIAPSAEAFCVESALRDTPRASTASLCPESVVGAPGVPGSPRHAACNDSGDPVLAELSGLGKAGVKLARAREEVLEILRSDNACTEWIRSKDAKPADTFQSLNFLLDQHGPTYVLESRVSASIVMVRQPYVARATQDGGAHTAITINAYGAFYRTQGNALRVLQEGGPPLTDGSRLLTVGDYLGDTLPAQMVTLLHEFGHIIDLLPEDADNLDGKSVRNTDEVLRHCRGEVESRSQLAKLTTAKR